MHVFEFRQLLSLFLYHSVANLFLGLCAKELFMQLLTKRAILLFWTTLPVCNYLCKSLYLILWNISGRNWTLGSVWGFNPHLFITLEVNCFTAGNGVTEFLETQFIGWSRTDEAFWLERESLSIRLIWSGTIDQDVKSAWVRVAVAYGNRKNKHPSSGDCLIRAVLYA